MMSELLDIGNLIILFGTLFLLKEVIKDRKILKGYSTFGSFLTFVSIFIFMVYYAANSIWLSIFLSVPTLLYWMFAFGFKVIYNE